MAILKSKQARPGYAAGIYSDMTLDGPEIGTLVAVIDRAKNLPNRKTIGKQDPYCAMRLGKEAKKTDTDRRGGQTPKWDQELRFTVHESPDYYKLKCSVFNDDKRTDLIGESWIDLTDVIRLGGGQSDIWHQLSFKGKYAGEVRVELTFYDSREKPQERKKSKDILEASPSASASDLSVSAPRSLGPREIKRRPLPTNPAIPTPPQAKSITIENPKPHIPPKIYEDEQPQQYRQAPQSQSIHAPIPIRSRGASASPQPQLPSQSQFQEQQYEENEHYSPQGHNTQQTYYQQRQPMQAPHTERSIQLQPQQRQQSWHDTNEPQYRDIDQQCYSRDNTPARIEDQPYSHPQEQMRQPQMSTYPDEHEIWQSQRPQSFHTHSAPITPHDSPSHRPLPSSTNSDGQLVRYNQQYQRTDPTFASATHTNSPLRHSMSSEEVGLPMGTRQVIPPPLPPKHRDTTPRRSRNECPPSAYIPQPLRIGGSRSPVSERSPLQSSNDDYTTHRQERFAEYHTQRHSMYEPQYEQRYESPQEYEQPGQLELYGRRQTYDEQPRYSDTQLHRPMQQSFDHSRRNSYDNRDSTYNHQVTEEPQPLTPNDGYHSGHDYGYQAFVEDAPPSPGLQPVLSRKPVGAQPKALNGVPFGPDAYDVLNPAGSPVTNVNTKFQTPAQIKEAERLKEVAKIRELGPIIGNDGRVIDPSDHLPSDTWAPEPERKNRKPEHVVHIRSKNDPKRPAGARGSPLIAKGNGPQSVYSNAASQPASSPMGRTPPGDFPGGRNRLQKSMPTPTRALPNQPYSLPAGPTKSSPALASSPQDMYENRRPSYDNRTPSHLARPPLSEYQVPVGNSYTPRTKSYERETPKTIEPAYETPSKQPSYQAYPSPASGYERRSSYNNRGSSPGHRNSDYAYENGYHHNAPPSQPQRTQHYDDPLAAEMSLIDIGPSRHGQSPGHHQGAMVRSRGRW